MMNFDSTSKMSKEAMDSMLTTMSAMTKGFQQITAEATDYSKKSYEDSAAPLKSWFRPRASTRPSKFRPTTPRTSYETFVAQATKMSELYADHGQGSLQAFRKGSCQGFCLISVWQSTCPGWKI
jgi:hypothetical protein